tara:strand:+ start:726 stop:857 length:132 start_codon:yes stop_codon:yes gene_type:complete
MRHNDAREQISSLKKIPREFLGISRKQQFESLNVNDPQDDLLC